MTFMTLIGLWIVWLVIAAVLLRWIIGGTIDCFKHGSRAGITSWMGLVITLIILILILS